MRVAPVGLILGFFCISANAVTFLPLGDLPGGTIDSYARGVSGNGLVVAGFSQSASGREAVYWSSTGTMTSLGLIGGFTGSEVTDASTDGSVLLGRGSPTGASRWTLGTGWVSVSGLTPGGPMQPFAISGDGSVIVGRNSSGPMQATRWTSGSGISVGLGDLPGGDFDSIALDVSADGSIVVGYGSGASGSEAFRWTAGGGMVGLGLPGGASSTAAQAISADGSVIVGGIGIGFCPGGFRWTAGGGMVVLPGFAGACNFGVASVSGDGSVIGLSADYLGDRHAFIWDASGDTQRLFDVLVVQGATGLTGWTLSGVNGISADGHTIAGFGTNPLGNREAFVVTGFNVVPIPPAVWLFGSTLGVMGVMRRKTA